MNFSFFFSISFLTKPVNFKHHTLFVGDLCDRELGTEVYEMLDPQLRPVSPDQSNEHSVAIFKDHVKVRLFINLPYANLI